jgi:hypothetical protein
LGALQAFDANRVAVAAAPTVVSGPIVEEYFVLEIGPILVVINIAAADVIAVCGSIRAI